MKGRRGPASPLALSLRLLPFPLPPGQTPSPRAMEERYYYPSLRHYDPSFHPPPTRAHTSSAPLRAQAAPPYEVITSLQDLDAVLDRWALP